jgi:ParB family chromosome partitioning protein
LKLPAEIQMGVKDKKIDMGHAKAILSLDDAATQLMVYEQIIEYGFSVRKTEEIVRTINEEQGTEKVAKKKTKTPQEYVLLKDHLSKFFDTKVQFSCNEKGQGKITIPFSSEQDLERIVQVFDSLKK